MATITRPRGAPPEGPWPSEGGPPPDWQDGYEGGHENGHAPDGTRQMRPVVDPWDDGKPRRKAGKAGKAAAKAGAAKPQTVKIPKEELTPRQLVRRQRRRRRRILIGLAVMTIVVDLVVGFGTAYLRWRIGQIKRIELPSLAVQEPGQPMNVLLVGSDSRSRLTGNDAIQAGKDSVQGQRSDTIMVLHVDPTRQNGALLSIPRDLYVPIAGTNGSDRINSAFSLGGADQLIATINQSLKININHYAEVDFVGFKEIIDAVGGVKVYVPAPARDLHSQLNVTQTGCVNLNGTQGLAWVRSRFYEELVGGQWRSDPSGDLGRIRRQQELLRKMAKEASAEGKSNPLALNRLIGIGVDNLTLDSALSTSDLTELAKRLRDIDPDSLDMFTLPTSFADINGASVLLLKEAEAKPIVDRINGVTNPEPTATTTTVPANLTPKDVRMRVLNGVGVAGAAGKAGVAFTSAGFSVAERQDADSSAYTRTVVRHAPGKVQSAQLVQSYLAGGAGDIQEDRTLTGVDVAVVIGQDYTGLRAPTVTPTTVAAGGATAGTATTTPAVTATTLASATTTTPTTAAGPPTTVRPAC